METVTVLGWVVWGLVLLYGLISLLSRHPDGGVRAMMRVKGLTLLAACAAVVALSVSHFWVLAALPVAFYIPLIWVSMRLGGMNISLEKLHKESQTTGVPLDELLRRETEKMRDGKS